MTDVLGLRVRDLADDQRALLLAVAIDGQLTGTDLVTLAGLEPVERAVRDRLVTLTESGRARPWHPLLAAAAREVATPMGRQAMHRRLAELVTRPEQRVRHLALAASEPDEELADALSASAQAAGDRGATETALELAELALARSPEDSPRRTARVLDLATRMIVVNEAERLRSFLEPEIERMPHGPERGGALLMLLNGTWDDVAHAQHLVERALAECADDPGVRGRALEARSFIAGGISVASAADCLAWAEEAIGLGAHEEDEWQMQGRARSWCLVRGGQPPDPPEGEPLWKRLTWRGELAAAEAAVRDGIAAAEEAGRFQESESYWERLFDVLERSGRVREARQFLDGLLDLDLSANEATTLEVMRAVVESRYGDVSTAREWATLGRAHADRFGDVWNRLEADHVLALAALQSGEPEAAEALLRGVLDHVVGAGLLEPGAFPVAPDLVEALALQDGYDAAYEVIAWLAATRRRPGASVGSRDDRAVPGAGRAARRDDPSTGRVGAHHGRGRPHDDPRTAARRGPCPPGDRLCPSSPTAVGPRARPPRRGRVTLRGARRGRLGRHRPRGARPGGRPSPGRRRGADAAPSSRWPGSRVRAWPTRRSPGS